MDSYEDRAGEERPAELSEDELAEQRRAKFGALPPRVRSSEMVETADAGAAVEEPPEPAVRREWG
jgi:hypothetical protein